MDLARTKPATLLRAAAWTCISLLVILSWMPAGWRSDISWTSGKVEHFVAYFGATTVIGLAYQGRRVRLALSLVTYAAILEIGQLFTLSRTASVWDFAMSAAGVVTAAATLPLVWRAFVKVVAVLSRR